MPAGIGPLISRIELFVQKVERDGFNMETDRLGITNDCLGGI